MQKQAKKAEAEIAWEGDSKEIISGFPEAVKEDLGYQLRLLQWGEEPLDYRPMPSVGRGVVELRDQDEKTWYRVLYLSRVGNTIYVLHCFEKQGAKTPANDIKTAQQRLKEVRRRLLKERKHAK